MHESKLTRDNVENFMPNNSNKAKNVQVKKPAEERKKVEPVVKRKVNVKNKTFGQKFKEAFLGDTDSVGDYLVNDILVPAIKSTLSEMVTGGLEILLYGERKKDNVLRDRGRTFVSYNTRYNERPNRDREVKREISKSARSKHDFRTVIFDSRGEAENVLSHLVDQVLEYGEVPVSTFYELCDVESQYTDDKYGWTNLRDAFVERVRNGYIINFPSTRPL